LLRADSAARTASECSGFVPREVRNELDELVRELGSGDLLGRVQRQRHALATEALVSRRRTLMRIRESIARLQALPSRSEIIDAAPREACRSCGFARALLSRIDGSTWVPEVLSATQPSGATDDFRAYLSVAEIPLEHMLLETDMVRRGRPVLVRDAPGDTRTHKAIIDASSSLAYTAAPIVPGRRAIGFLHCDRFGQEQPLTEEDRENLWAFTDQLAIVLDRITLSERLAEFESDLRRTLSVAFDDITGIRTAGLILGEEQPGIVAEGSGPEAAPTSRLMLALTGRQREVLEHMATGATNADIADALVVSETTIKTHVRHILRKLRVSNRSQAVARYLPSVTGRGVSA
jgi:DNA-binding CsgD family transcriptional regulator